MRRWARFAALLVCVTLSGCASMVPAPAMPRFLLLGEVHDNAEGHARRLRDLRDLVAQGWRPAIAMEQFDLDRAKELTQAQQACADADCVIRQAGGPGWDWSLYRPVIELALEHRLPLVAANLSRTEAIRVVRGGLEVAFTPAVRQAFGLPQSVAASLRAAQEAEVERGHCGLAPRHLLAGLASAQIARDIGMAQAMLEHRARGVVLLAGHGHVRLDIGVPYWLRQQGAEGVRVVAYLERGTAAPGGVFDAQVVVPPVAREDPCATLRMPAR